MPKNPKHRLPRAVALLLLLLLLLVLPQAFLAPYVCLPLSLLLLLLSDERLSLDPVLCYELRLLRMVRLGGAAGGTGSHQDGADCTCASISACV